jgi:hypothetical protein
MVGGSSKHNVLRNTKIESFHLEFRVGRVAFIWTA